MATSAEREGVREAFRGLYLKDRERGEVRSLEHYQGLFPGFSEVVAEEYGRIRTPSDTPRDGHTVTSEGSSSQAGVAAPPAPSGDRIGPYRILRELGRGGMGVVYEAQDTRLPRRVALKVLSPQFTLSTHLRMRFEREAAIAAKLDHPNICTVYEAGEADGTPFMAMLFLEGKPLSEWIGLSKERRRPSGVVTLPPLEERPPEAKAPAGEPRKDLDRILVLVEKAARALHAAHEKGLIHRDIKPHNIIVRDDGEPVLLDFGLAREEEGEGHGLTQTGSLMGTPAYLSPEQLAAQRIKLDRRTDVYSLGVTLYECLTLQLPFEAPTLDGLYQKILMTEPEDPRRLNDSIPRDLKVVVETAIERNRERRYQTALDLAEDLRRVREHEPIAAKPAGPLLRLWRWAERRPAVAGTSAALFLSLSAGLAVSLDLLGEARQERDAKEAALKETRAERDAKETALQDNNRLLKEVERKSAERAAALRNLEASQLETRRTGLLAASVASSAEDPVRGILLAREAARIGMTPEVFARLNEAIAGSPERVAFRDLGINVWDTMLLADVGRIVTSKVTSKPTWSSTDREGRVSYDTPYAVTTTIWDLDGKRIAEVPGEPKFTGLSSWPRSRFLTVERDPAPSEKSPLRLAVVRDADGGVVASLPVDGKAVTEVFLSPYADRLVLALTRGGFQVVDLGGRALRTLVPEDGEDPSRDWLNPRFSSDGRTVVVQGPRRRVAFCLETGSRCSLDCPGNDDWGNRSVDFSKAGDLVLFAVGGVSDGVRSIRAVLWNPWAGTSIELGAESNALGIVSVQLSPDGELALLATSQAVHLFPTSGGSDEGTTFPLCPEAAIFAPSGNALFTSHQEGAIKKWDLRGNLLWSTRTGVRMVRGLAFEGSGRKLIAGPGVGAPRVWEPEGDEALPWMDTGLRHGRMNFLLVSEDGGRLLALSDYHPSVVAIEFGPDGRLRREVGKGEVAFYGFPPALTRDGKILVRTDVKGVTSLFLLDEGRKEVLDWKGYWCAASPDGNRIAVARSDGNLFLDGTGKELFRTSVPGCGRIESSRDGNLILCDWKNMWRNADQHSHELAGARLWSVDGRVLLDIGLDLGEPHPPLEEIDRLLLEHERIVAAYLGVKRSPPGDAVQVSAARNALVTSTLGLKSLLQGLERAGEEFKEPLDRVSRTLRSTADTCFDKDLPRARLCGELIGVHLSQEGDGILAVPGEAGLWDGKVMTRDPLFLSPLGEILAHCKGLPAAATCAAISTDGRLFAAGTKAGTVVIWTRNGELKATLEGQREEITRVAFSPDGKLLATVSLDEARLWTADGRPVATLPAHRVTQHSYQGGSLALEFSPDGKRLATWGGYFRSSSPTFEPTVRLWDASGALLGTMGHPAQVAAVRFLPDGRLVTLAMDGILRTWLTDADALLALADRRSTRPFTLEERRRYRSLLGEDNEGILWEEDLFQRFKAHVAVLREIRADTERSAAMKVAAIASAEERPIDMRKERNDIRIAGLKAIRANRLEDAAWWLRRMIEEADSTGDKEHAGSLNQLAWELVKQPGRDEATYEMALQAATRAVKLQAGYYDFSVAVAQYRRGRFLDAAETIRRLDRWSDGRYVPHVAFLAMALWRAGESEDARREYGRLQGLVADPQIQRSPEMDAFIEEARLLIEGRVPPGGAK